MTSKEIEQELVVLWEQEYPNQNKDFPRCYTWEKLVVPLSSLKTKTPKDKKKANLYYEKLMNGGSFPPLVVIDLCGQQQIIDGLHRTWAYKKAGQEMVEIYNGKMK